MTVVNVANNLYVPSPVGSRIHITLHRQHRAERARARAREKEKERAISFVRDVLQREMLSPAQVIMQG